MIVGYARVSTDGQTLDAQQSALAGAGAEKVFAEKVSGAVTDRKALTRAIAALDAGDVLLVTRLDRLARSTRDLLNVLDAVAKAGAGFRSLADAWADTTTPHGKLMIAILGGLAEFECSLILARTSEGRTRAKAPGRKVWPEACAHRAPAGGSVGASRSWRGLYRNCPQLRGEPLDYFAARLNDQGEPSNASTSLGRSSGVAKAQRTNASDPRTPLPVQRRIRRLEPYHRSWPNVGAADQRSTSIIKYH